VHSATAIAAASDAPAVAAATKPRLGLAAIGNLSFGFFGIQIAFALQTANVSRIFQTLGASIEALPILWVAGPVTGLLVQPVIGYLSDRTWGRLGRRRPYFLAGALLSTTALVLLPNAPYLWLAVLAFWLLDISLNVSMEPFRAFVGDMLPDEQRTTGYAVQTIFIGCGALAASAAPWLFTNVLGVAGDAPPGIVPAAVRVAFYVGAVALFAAVLWTVISTREYSPAQLASFAAGSPAAPAAPAQAAGRVHPLRELVTDFLSMPRVMRRLAVIQFFSWCGFFVLWIYGTPVVAHHHFGGAAPGTAAYNGAGDWVGVLFAAYNGVAALYAFLLPPLAARFGRERVHAANLLAGAAGFAGFVLTRDPRLLLLSMVGIGMAWASVLTMPYALLCGAIPYRKLGVYMGIFNFFIVLPQLVVAGVMGAVVRVAFPGDPAGVMALAGGSLVLAAVLAWRRVRA
jgi:maltose/moltooligosaccharide transporter